MEIVGLGISFDVPPAWTYFKDGPRFVLHGEAQQEVIISGRYVTVPGRTARENIVDVLLANAKQAALDVASDPELQLLSPMTEVRSDEDLKVWRIDAKSRDGETLFLQAVVGHSFGVALVTFEVPASSAARDEFSRLIRSTSAIKASGT
jgi:hypothetical protein